MKAPISWLKEYVDIKLPLKIIMWKLTEIGLTCESYEKINNQIILNIEVTPNRPDWLSMTGIAREIAIIQNKNLALPKLTPIPKAKTILPININFKTKLTGGYAGIIIKDVIVKQSPNWMQERLKLIGLRPINNLVDITNYVMFELGIPIHVFDYDKFENKNLSMELSQGGETFTSVDELSYTLPKNTLIIKDNTRVVDLCGIKGGLNTGISKDTKNIFIHTPIYNGSYIRQASKTLKLVSDASYIYERCPNPKMIPDTLNRVVDLTLKLAGGSVASKAFYNGLSKLPDKKIILKYSDVNETLGIIIDKNKIKGLLKQLDFSLKDRSEYLEIYSPIFRNDISIKEDIFEEIARIYGYNNFEKTLPEGSIAKVNIPYKYDRGLELNLKNIMAGCGFYETNTLSLYSIETIKKSLLNYDDHFEIYNPVSKEYQFFRTSLIPSILEAVKINTNEKVLKLFEYNKVFLSQSSTKGECYKLSAVTHNSSYERLKGVFDLINDNYQLPKYETKKYIFDQGLWHPEKSGVVEIENEDLAIIGELNPRVLNNFGIKGNIHAMEVNIQTLIKYIKPKLFRQLPKYPGQVEDITLIIPTGVQVEKAINEIHKSSKYIDSVILDDKKYKNRKTFRILYQSYEKTLTDAEVKQIRKNYIKRLKIYQIKEVV